MTLSGTVPNVNTIALFFSLGAHLIIAANALFSREALANRSGDVTVGIGGDGEERSFKLDADKLLKFKTSNHTLLIRALYS